MGANAAARGPVAAGGVGAAVGAGFSGGGAAGAGGGVQGPPGGAAGITVREGDWKCPYCSALVRERERERETERESVCVCSILLLDLTLVYGLILPMRVCMYPYLCCARACQCGYTERPGKKKRLSVPV